MTNRLLHCPASLAGILHVAANPLESRVFRERPLGQLEEPRAHHAALVPQAREPLEIVTVLARPQDLEALGVGLHQAILDAVVDHLGEVARARGADMEPTVGRSERVEGRREPSDRIGVAAQHHAKTLLEPPDPARGPHVHELHSASLEAFVTTTRITIVGVSPIHDEVAPAELGLQPVDQLVHRWAGGNHRP